MSYFDFKGAFQKGCDFSIRALGAVITLLQSYTETVLLTHWRPAEVDLPVGTVDAANGPIAIPRKHTVRFGRVEGENRGPNVNDLIYPPIERNDEYYWLRDDERCNPLVLQHIQKENEFTKKRTATLENLRDILYKEHVENLKEDDDSLPFQPYQASKYFYFTRNRKGRPYECYCRVASEILRFDEYRQSCARIQSKGKRIEGPKIYGEEIILDVNDLALSKGAKFCSVYELVPNPQNAEIHAYSVDFVGGESYDIHFTGVQWAPILSTTGDFVWSPNGSYIFYGTKDDAQRPFRVWIHKNGTDPSQDICIFEEKDDVFEISFEITRCRTYLILHSASTETTEAHLLHLHVLESTTLSKDMVLENLECVRPREYGVRYTVDPHLTGHLYVLTNYNDAKNNALLRISHSKRTTAAGFSQAEVMVPHRHDRFLESVEVFQDGLVLTGRESGLSQIWTMSLHESDCPMRKVTTPDPIYSVSFAWENYVFEAEWIRMDYSTPHKPRLTVDLNLESHAQVVLAQETVNQYDPEEYEVDRLVANSFDNTPVHISVISKKGVKRDSSNPVLLYGYGAYGACTEPRFRRSWIPLLKRGVVCCIAHIRGGSENGQLWYETGGKYLTKRNTFMDFIACAEHLIEQGLTNPNKIAIEGRSAGGLLIGAVLNMRPDLFKVAIADVPFVDAMTTMCDASIPLTAGEWEEWGNPNEYRFHEYILSYSPIDNVRAQSYPHVLIQAGLHDQRVQFWEPVKWASKIRSLTTSDNDVLVKIDSHAGHFSASDRYRYLEEMAFEQSYILSKIL